MNLSRRDTRFKRTETTDELTFRLVRLWHPTGQSLRQDRPVKHSHYRNAVERYRLVSDVVDNSSTNRRTQTRCIVVEFFRRTNCDVVVKKERKSTP